MPKEDMVRIFARKCFEFRRYVKKDGKMVIGDKARTVPMGIVDLPAWIASDPMFGWARSDGDIEVLLGRADEQKAQIKASGPKASNKIRTEKVTSPIGE